MKFPTISALTLAAGCIFYLDIRESKAEPESNFYAQRTLQLIVPYAPGGSFDLYARMVAEHFPSFVPGRPTMVVRNMPGAGGLRGTHAMYQSEPQDGSSLAILPRGIATNQMLRPETAKYDARRFGWIGGISTYTGVVYVFSRTGINDAQDLTTRPFILGSLGQATDSFSIPTLLNSLLGSNVDFH